MPVGVTGALVGAGISAAGSLAAGAIGGALSGGAAGSAGGISQAAIAAADANRLADRATYQPFVNQGTTAINALGDALGINGADASAAARANFQASPGYQYQLDQGLRAVDSGGAARGLLRSGATLKAEQTLGSNLANQDFGQYLTRLNTLGTTGLQATQGQANSTAAFNNLLSGQATNQAEILGQSASQQGSIYGNAISGVTSAIKSVPWSNVFGGGGSFTGTPVTGNEFGGAGTTLPATVAF